MPHCPLLSFSTPLPVTNMFLSLVHTGSDVRRRVSTYTASQTKATAIYALSELRFSCSHRKDVRSHREGPYMPSGVSQRKTTLFCVKTSFDTCTLIGWSIFRNSSRGLTFCDLQWTCPHYCLVVYDAAPSSSDFKDSTGEFSKYRKTLTHKFCKAIHTRPPQVARPIYVSKCLWGLRPGEVWCGQGISPFFYPNDLSWSACWVPGPVVFTNPSCPLLFPVIFNHSFILKVHRLNLSRCHVLY